MRNSSILKLAKKNNKLVNGTKNAGGGGGKEEKKWLHAPETLLAGHVVYLVKVSAYDKGERERVTYSNLIPGSQRTSTDSEPN